MELDKVDRFALLLGKDAQDVATKKVQLDLDADVSTEEEIMKYASAIEMTNKKQEALIMQCLSRFEEATDLTSSNVELSVKEIISEEMNSIDTKKHRWVSDFDTSIKRIKIQAQEQDDELEMVEDTNIDNKKRTKCPITKCTFVNPVKSKICNHTYSRDAIMELLARSRSISCPVSGCSKKVTESDLVPDEDMIWYLEKRDY